MFNINHETFPAVFPAGPRLELRYWVVVVTRLTPAGAREALEAGREVPH